MFDLQRVHGLLEVRRGTLNLHRVSHREGTVRELDRGDSEMAEKVEDLAYLLPFHRPHMVCTR